MRTMFCSGVYFGVDALCLECNYKLPELSVCEVSDVTAQCLGEAEVV